MEEIINIKVILDQIQQVKGKNVEVNMILFHGEVQSPYFTGKIMPGAVDTQMGVQGIENKLSARYMMEGVDDSGQRCHIFIENNGIDHMDGSSLVTTPRIITDSLSLGWMEDAELSGTVEGEEDCVRIKIYKQ